MLLQLATKVTKSQAKFFNCNFVSHAAACVGYSLMRGRQRTFCEKKTYKVSPKDLETC